jgi:hypothetical protein
MDLRQKDDNTQTQSLFRLAPLGSQCRAHQLTCVITVGEVPFVYLIQNEQNNRTTSHLAENNSEELLLCLRTSVISACFTSANKLGILPGGMDTGQVGPP